MSDRIKKIKVKKADGSMTDYIPIGVDAENVDFDNGYKLNNIVGSINPDESGSIAAQLSKSIKYYDCVADMKADTTLKVNGAARTLGYYEPGDGGGAIYNIVEDDTLIDDGGSVHNLDNSLKAKLIIDKEINVKQFGSYGDGIHDDYQTIQNAINYGKNKTIYFPDNSIFLISKHIYTSAQHDEKQFLQLAPNTIIKATDSFSDEYVIRLGEIGQMEGYSASNFITGLDGGTIDANLVTNGIVSERTHLARLTNTNVINAKEVGIKVAQSNNASSDAWLENLYILGSETGAQIGIGLWIDGHDNNILMVRTSKMHTGIKITGGGNFLKNCHPLYGARNENNEYYNSSVAFHFTKDDTHFEQCYNDNFSTGWFQDGDIRWSSVQMFNYWYENYNYKHTWIKVNSSDKLFRGKLNGVFGNMPSQGVNRILIQENDYLHPYGLGPKQDTWGSISDINFNSTKTLLNFYTDEAFTNNILNIQNYVLFNTEYVLQKNVWYPFLFYTGNQTAELDIKLNIGYHISVNLTISSNNSTNTEIQKIDVQGLGVPMDGLEIGTQTFTFNDDGLARKMKVFYFKMIANNSDWKNGITGSVGVSLIGGNILNSKIVIPPRNLDEHTTIWNLISETVENPITVLQTVMNTRLSTNNMRLTPKGTKTYAQTQIIQLPTTAHTVLVTIHYSSYNFVYLLHVWSNLLTAKELLEEPNSVGHEPSLIWSKADKTITITMSDTGIIDYVLL